MIFFQVVSPDRRRFHQSVFWLAVDRWRKEWQLQLIHQLITGNQFNTLTSLLRLWLKLVIRMKHWTLRVFLQVKQSINGNDENHYERSRLANFSFLCWRLIDPRGWIIDQEMQPYFLIVLVLLLLTQILNSCTIAWTWWSRIRHVFTFQDMQQKVCKENKI